jgi:hypothetical protein
MTVEASPENDLEKMVVFTRESFLTVLYQSKKSDYTIFQTIPRPRNYLRKPLGSVLEQLSHKVQLIQLVNCKTDLLPFIIKKGQVLQ